jgi:hypothetical protein
MVDCKARYIVGHLEEASCSTRTPDGQFLADASNAVVQLPWRWAEEGKYIT